MADQALAHPDWKSRNPEFEASNAAVYLSLYPAEHAIALLYAQTERARAEYQMCRRQQVRHLRLAGTPAPLHPLDRLLNDFEPEPPRYA